MASTRAAWPPQDIVSLSSDEGEAGPAPPALQQGDAEPREHHQQQEEQLYDLPFDGMDPGIDRVEDLLDDWLAADEANDAAVFAEAQNEGQHANQQDPNQGQYMYFAGERVFIPREQPDPSPSAAQDNPQLSAQHSFGAATTLPEPPFTVDTCLSRVLEIFPDISHDHVKALYDEFDKGGEFEVLPGPARLDNIIEQLVSGQSYPKQEKGSRANKRKREDSPSKGDQGPNKWNPDTRPPFPRNGNVDRMLQHMLKGDFPGITQTFIADAVKTHRFLFQSYVALAKAEDDSASGQRLYGKGRPSLNTNATILREMQSAWPELVAELEDARTHVAGMRKARQEEQENLERAKECGTLTECSACFDELPMNRQIYCGGVPAHFTCFDCALTYVKTKVGEAQCTLPCPAGCGAFFASQQLNLLSDKRLLEKLAQLQQEKDIREAELQDLEECPFCDFKAIAPPIDEDFEFRCANPDCEIVSCRRCRMVSHIPISCEQYAKENKLNSRHKVEEAMTAAMIRSCNKCKKPFVKDFGCNKMSCPACGNKQCYVCSKTINDYNHFDQSDPHRPGPVRQAGNGGKCPLYDDVQKRHEQEVRNAENETRERLVQENPDLDEKDLEIKMKDMPKTPARRGNNEAERPFFLQRMARLNQLDQQFPAPYDGAADLDWVMGAARQRFRVRGPQRAQAVNKPDENRALPAERGRAVQSGAQQQPQPPPPRPLPQPLPMPGDPLQDQFPRLAQAFERANGLLNYAPDAFAGLMQWPQPGPAFGGPVNAPVVTPGPARAAPMPVFPQPIGNNQPVQPVQAVQLVQPAQPVQPVQPAQPVQPVQAVAVDLPVGGAMPPCNCPRHSPDCRAALHQQRLRQQVQLVQHQNRARLRLLAQQQVQVTRQVQVQQQVQVPQHQQVQQQQQLYPQYQRQQQVRQQQQQYQRIQGQVWLAQQQGRTFNVQAAQQPAVQAGNGAVQPPLGAANGSGNAAANVSANAPATAEVPALKSPTPAPAAQNAGTVQPQPLRGGTQPGAAAAAGAVIGARANEQRPPDAQPRERRPTNVEDLRAGLDAIRNGHRQLADVRRDQHNQWAPAINAQLENLQEHHDRLAGVLQIITRQGVALRNKWDRRGAAPTNPSGVGPNQAFLQLQELQQDVRRNDIRRQQLEHIMNDLTRQMDVLRGRRQVHLQQQQQENAGQRVLDWRDGVAQEVGAGAAGAAGEGAIARNLARPAGNGAASANNNNANNGRPAPAATSPPGAGGVQRDLPAARSANAVVDVDFFGLSDDDDDSDSDDDDDDDDDELDWDNNWDNDLWFQ